MQNELRRKECKASLNGRISGAQARNTSRFSAALSKHRQTEDRIVQMHWNQSFIGAEE